MIKKHIFIIAFFILDHFILTAQDVYERQESVDVKSYVFNLKLSDETNVIKGEALVTADFNNPSKQLTLDLIKKSGLYGMTITGVFEEDRALDYSFSDNKMTIPLTSKKTKTRTFKIQYEGIPEKGLVIGKTKFGQRSFFGDNWPNLARHWLPCVDHPYDKAAVTFKVTAPEHYDVVATGKKTEESHLGNGFKLWVYEEPAPVATKVVTIGVTKFATKLLGMVDHIPVTAWVYPENRSEGFSDYTVAANAISYFVKNIGPFPFAKLANVQASTQWGGLENAGTITYPENSVTGNKTYERTIAHEIAHQWFGDSATENSWNEVWLSEGFATYFAMLYQEAVYGNEKRKEELEIDRKEIIEYYKENPSPVVDNTIKDPMKVLSINTYQKGSWVLNMLRHKLGNAIFWEGIRYYYKKNRDQNVITADFREAMEVVSGQDLKEFFEQWIFTKGYPELQWNWNYHQRKLKLNVKQVQKHHIFTFPLEVAFIHGNQIKIETFNLDSESKTFEVKMDSKPDALILDPEVWLLYEDKN